MLYATNAKGIDNELQQLSFKLIPDVISLVAKEVAFGERGGRPSTRKAAFWSWRRRARTILALVSRMKIMWRLKNVHLCLSNQFPPGFSWIIQ